MPHAVVIRLAIIESILCAAIIKKLRPRRVRIELDLLVLGPTPRIPTRTIRLWRRRKRKVTRFMSRTIDFVLDPQRHASLARSCRFLLDMINAIEIALEDAGGAIDESVLTLAVAGSLG